MSSICCYQLKKACRAVQMSSELTQHAFLDTVLHRVLNFLRLPYLSWMLRQQR
jgi:hypothetical protein